VAVPLAGARRILVAGASGSGKTTLAARIAVAAGVPHTEIDALHWHEGWRPNPAFADEVRALVARERWVTEWQYDSARPVLADRAELLVWLDPPRPVVLTRVVRRTLRRRLGRVPLWSGNVEPPLRTFFTDRDHVIRWSMRTFGLFPARIRTTLAAHPDLRLVRIRSAADAERLLALLRH
jgi:adenylate kinase family enzyme